MDLVPLLGNRRPDYDWVGVVGRHSEPRVVGEIKEEDETTAFAGGEFSEVRGT